MIPPLVAARARAVCSSKKKELAVAVNLPVRTLERLTANGVIPVLRITPRLVRYELPAVLAALRRYETATLKK
ncbi:MAG: hypothetical protein JO295_04090 [Verrucomicrobia bacterium]|nr:hypothetical protein [Verrucomicrobiota bacterium]